MYAIAQLFLFFAAHLRPIVAEAAASVVAAFPVLRS